MIRIFGRERQTLTSDVDTWIVKWRTYRGWSSRYPDIEECHKAFTNKDEAKEYAKALNDARKLLGITVLENAEVYKQEVNSV